MRIEVAPKRFYCELCGERCPKQFMVNGHEAALKRRSWMHRHKQRKHPELKSRTLHKVIFTQELKQSEAEKE